MALARKEDSENAVAYVLQLAAEHGQAEAARAFGFSQAYVSRLSRGAVARLRQQTVDVIESVRAGESSGSPSLADALARVVRSVVDVGASPEHAKRTKLVGALGDATDLVSALSVALRRLEDGAP